MSHKYSLVTFRWSDGSTTQSNYGKSWQARSSSSTRLPQDECVECSNQQPNASHAQLKHDCLPPTSHTSRETSRVGAKHCFYPICPAESRSTAHCSPSAAWSSEVRTQTQRAMVDLTKIWCTLLALHQVGNEQKGLSHSSHRYWYGNHIVHSNFHVWPLVHK